MLLDLPEQIPLEPYEKLVINKSKKKIETIVRKFKTNAHNGTQVKELEIILDHLSNHLYSILPTIFPNLTELKTPLLEIEEKERDQTTVDALFQWNDTFEVISPYLDRYEKGTQFDIQAIDCLKHAPVLKEFRLDYCEVDMNLLGDIHAASPQLESLILCESIILMDDTVMSEPLVPAANLTSFKADIDTVACDQKCIFLDYLIAKYPNLITFDFKCDSEGLLLQNFYESEPKSARVRKVNTIKRDMQATDKIYAREGAKFFSKVLATFKNLKMDSTMFPNVLELLCQAEISPTTLKLTDEAHPLYVFKEPKQFDILKELKSLMTLFAGINSSMLAYFGDTVISDKMKTLKVSICDNSSEEYIDFHWFMAAFPCLQDFTINNSDIALEINELVPKKVYSHLRSLVIMDIEIHPNVY